MPNRRNRRAAAVLASAALLLIVIVSYAAYTTYRHVTRYLISPGCRAGTGQQAVSLDPEQASIASTIAGVAASERLPDKAVTIAYATAMQESHMHNLTYGDRDSVGVFQQRPSEGWGTAGQLRDPVYAATKFFAALVRVPGYLDMPVDQAAQAVQHSADGNAYGNYDLMAEDMTAAFTGGLPHAVWCWSAPGPQPRANLSAARDALDTTFGPPGPDSAVAEFATSRSSGQSTTAVVRVRSAPWTVAAWLVTHAADYGITQVRYDGYTWSTAHGTQGWRAGTEPDSGSILLD